MMNIGEKPVLSTHGVVTSLAWSMGGKVNYVLEGNLNYTGAVITWLKDDLKLIQSPGETEVLAREAVRDDSLYLIPAFSGLGAPYWNSSARGMITGITRGTSREHIIRASLEGIAYEVCDLVQAMQKDAGVKIMRLAVDGGACANNFLMQFQSDILNCIAVRPKISETTALGAAYLAGLNAGCWQNLEEIKSNFAVEREFVPAMGEAERIKLLNGWREAVNRANL